jgi:hypothetical protein
VNNLVAFIGCAPAPLGTSPAIPSGSVALFDASQHSTITLSSSPAADGGLVDTAGTWVQATGANQSTYDTLNLAGNVALIFGGGGQPNFSVITKLTMAALAYGIPFTIVMCGRIDGDSTLYELSTNVVSAQGTAIYSDEEPTTQVHGPLGLQTADILGPEWNTDNAIRYFRVVSDGTTVGLFVEANAKRLLLQISGVAPGTGAITTAATIGPGPVPFDDAMTSALGFHGIWSRALTDDEWANLRAYLVARWPLPNNTAAVSIAPISVGNSITAAWYAVANNDATALPYSWTNKAFTDLGTRFATCSNVAVGGARLNVDVGSIPSVLHQWTTGGGHAAAIAAALLGLKIVVTVEGGINDLLAAEPASNIGADMVTVVTQIVSDLNAVAGGPHHIFASTVSWVVGFTPAFYNNTNAAYVASVPGLATSNVHVHLVRPDTDAILGDQTRAFPGPSIYFHDSAHMTKPGYQRYSGLLRAAMLAAGL